MSGTAPGGNPRPLNCDELYEVAPDLALDLLDGAARAAALAHVEVCVACHTEVARLTETAAEPLLVAPEVPPPPGFEQRVLHRLGLAGDGAGSAGGDPDDPGLRVVARGPGRPRRVLVAALSAAAVVVLGAVVVVTLLAGGGGGPTETAAPMRTDDGAEVGEAVLRSGDPPELGVDLTAWAATWDRYDPVTDGPLRLAVQVDGRRDTYDLSPDDLVTQVTLEGTEASEVRSVAVVGENGEIWCRASFSRG